MSRSSARGPNRRGPRSLSATSIGSVRKQKSTRSLLSMRSKANQGYQKVKDAEEIEMAELGLEAELQNAPAPVYKSSEPKPHEIYQRTEYIPNTALRLLDVPMNSSLTFQKLLWFHSTYDWVYIILMLGGTLNRIQTQDSKTTAFATFACLLIWIPVELFRLRSGYSGNINENFPDLILFFGLSVCVLVLNLIPFVNLAQRFPHELSCIVINVLFTLIELVFGLAVGCNFMQKHFASFKLRTAPIIDKNFQKKYHRTADIQCKREMELGMQ